MPLLETNCQKSQTEQAQPSEPSTRRNEGIGDLQEERVGASLNRVDL